MASVAAILNFKHQLATPASMPLPRDSDEGDSGESWPTPQLPLGYTFDAQSPYFAAAGLGRPTPRTTLDVQSGASIAGLPDGVGVAIVTGPNQAITDVRGVINIYSNDAQAANKGAALGLGGMNDTATAAIFAQISGRKANGTAASTSGYFAIATRDSLGAMTEHFRINQTGLVGIGVAPGHTLDVQHSLTPGDLLDCTFDVGDNAQSGTSGLAGYLIDRFTDGSLYFDHKVITGQLINYRCGVNTEAGGTRTWMQVTPGTGKITWPLGKLNMTGLPTSTAGLSTGDVWCDTTGGLNILKVV